MEEIDLEENLNKRIPINYNQVVDKQPVIPIEKILKHQKDYELVLFELPKNFDKSLLNKIKIKNFGSNGKMTRLTNIYHGISFDSTHPIPRQTLSMFMKRDRKSFIFNPMDRYVKVFENIEVPLPTPENVVPRRLVIKKSIGTKKSKNKKKIKI